MGWVLAPHRFAARKEEWESAQKKSSSFGSFWWIFFSLWSHSRLTFDGNVDNQEFHWQQCYDVTFRYNVWNGSYLVNFFCDLKINILCIVYPFLMDSHQLRFEPIEALPMVTIHSKMESFTSFAISMICKYPVLKCCFHRFESSGPVCSLSKFPLCVRIKLFIVDRFYLSFWPIYAETFSNYAAQFKCTVSFHSVPSLSLSDSLLLFNCEGKKSNFIVWI